MLTRTKSNLYFKWLIEHVYDDRSASYNKLLSKLFNTDFYSVNERDDYRARDGLELRHLYEELWNDEQGDNIPCSVLEMMIALAKRAEDHIMKNEDEGDRTGQWFWTMIVSLGLGGMTDNNYSEETVNYILHRFLERQYEPNGAGSLFTLERPRSDMRDVEIWYQMNWFLSELNGYF